MTLLLCVIFFLSGASALLFETLWFRVAGLTLGNSIWASNIVLASFMGGLAAGNAAAARYGPRLRRPLFFYAVIEVVVGLAGVAIVVLLPMVTPSLAPLFSRAVAHPALVNSLRLAVGFTLMLVPATAMGLTLPLLTKTLEGRDPNFGRVLGRLYGWNTLGGMAGALCGELWLIPWMGQRGTALAAGALNLTAAVVALALTRRASEAAPAATHPLIARRLSPRAWRLLVAAFVAGGALLALEVIWFRFLQLFVMGTSLAFAVMLAVILLGIGAGGVVGARWLSRDPGAQRYAPLVALGAGLTTELCYLFFRPVVEGGVVPKGGAAAALLMSLGLMLPTSLLSGTLFTLLGAAQRNECGEAAETTGRLTLANTLGAMLGALVAGFVMLPGLGMEKSLFVLVLVYGVAAALSETGSKSARPERHRRAALVTMAALFALVVALFPFGLMRGRFMRVPVRSLEKGGEKVLGTTEGLTETITYLRTEWGGRPLYHRLVTNSHSMSATTHVARRYMKLYVWWALAVNPGARKALLISYGVGNTAKALVDTRQLESIDVVDISRDILELGVVAFPGGDYPLRDPRVRVHVEDGRFFLQTTKDRFDFITGEPPPPNAAGVVNLYSREYFQLVHDRLRQGGVVTYWLPVWQLHLSESQAIVRGFCDAFPDCSLWVGGGPELMLAGTRGAHGPVSEERFSAQWRDPMVAPELAALGLERPEQLGATFLADALTLAEWTRNAPPLDDDHPGRLFPWPPPLHPSVAYYRAWMEAGSARRRFASSAFIRDVWPPALRQRSQAYFDLEAVLDDRYWWHLLDRLESLNTVLTHSPLRTLALLLMGTEPAIQRIAVRAYGEGVRDPDVEFQMGARALASRDYAGAAEHFALVDRGTYEVRARLLQTLALGLLDKRDEARQALTSIDLSALSWDDAISALWLERFLRGELPGRSARPAHETTDGRD